jgi:hypothetical protein
MLRRRRKKIKTSIRTSISKKELKCITCPRIVEVDDDIVEVRCWYCATIACPGPELHKKVVENKTYRPRGWQKMKIFVDQEGTVYYVGIEQPELKGTLPITPIKPKKSKAERNAEKDKKEAKLAAKFAKKKEKQNGYKKGKREQGGGQ